MIYQMGYLTFFGCCLYSERNSLNYKFSMLSKQATLDFVFSGTPLIWPPTRHKNLAVLALTCIWAIWGRAAGQGMVFWPCCPKQSGYTVWLASALNRVRTCPKQGMVLRVQRLKPRMRAWLGGFLFSSSAETQQQGFCEKHRASFLWFEWLIKQLKFL